MADPPDPDDRLHAVVIEPALVPDGPREAREVAITRDGETKTIRTVHFDVADHPPKRATRRTDTTPPAPPNSKESSRSPGRTARVSLWQLGRHAAHGQLVE